MEIPKNLYQNKMIHHNINQSPEDGVISCGFFCKPSEKYSQKDIIFEHYGAFLLLRGSGTYYDEDGYEFELKPGDYVQRLPDKKHTTLVNPDGKWLEFFVCFGKRTYENLLELGLITNIPVIHPGLSGQILQKCNYLMECFYGFTDGQISLLYLSTQEFAMDMFKSAKNIFMDGEEYEQLCEAAEILCRSEVTYRNPKEAADMIGMPYERFRKRFKSVFGISPGAYQMKSRINESKTLLLDKDKTLNEIALLCGFADGFAYSKAFKKHCHISPREFCRNHLNL